MTMWDIRERLARYAEQEHPSPRVIVSVMLTAPLPDDDAVQAIREQLLPPEAR